MARVIIHMSFDEFARDVEGIFDRVARKHETIVVEKEGGEAVILGAAPKHEAGEPAYTLAPKTEADRQAFMSSLGGWADVDIDEFLRRVYESRNMPSRDRVDL